MRSFNLCCVAGLLCVSGLLPAAACPITITETVACDRIQAMGINLMGDDFWTGNYLAARLRLNFDLPTWRRHLSYRSTGDETIQINLPASLTQLVQDRIAAGAMHYVPLSGAERGRSGVVRSLGPVGKPATARSLVLDASVPAVEQAGIQLFYDDPTQAIPLPNWNKECLPKAGIGHPDGPGTVGLQLVPQASWTYALASTSLFEVNGPWSVECDVRAPVPGRLTVAIAHGGRDVAREQIEVGTSWQHAVIPLTVAGIPPSTTPSYFKVRLEAAGGECISTIWPSGVSSRPSSIRITPLPSKP